MKLTVGLPIVPFKELPIKKWEPGQEKKPRVPESEYLPPAEDVDDDDDSSSDDSNDSDGDGGEGSDEEESDDEESETSSTDSLLKHIENLLPGDFDKKGKANKQANKMHLEDLRPEKKPWKTINYRLWVYRKIKELRAKERERRKHYIIKDYEARVKRFDDMQKEKLVKEMEDMEKMLILDAYRRQERMRKNTAVQKKQSVAVEIQTRGLAQREREAEIIDFRVRNLSKWATERDDEKAAAREEEEKKQQEVLRIRADRSEAEVRQRRIDADQRVLDQDKAITKRIQTMMIQYGLLSIKDAPVDDSRERVDNVFRKSVQFRLRKSQQQEQMMSSSSRDLQDDADCLQLTLRNDDEDLLYNIHREHRRNIRDRTMLKKSKKKARTYENAFQQSLHATSSVSVLKGVNIGEVGGLSLASELTRGLCPMLEVLNLKGCRIKSAGVGQIFQAMKFANLMNVRVINLRGNHMRANVLEYMREICNSGVFSNLRMLILSDNELKDEGVEALIRIIVQGYFSGIEEIYLQGNSITDIGFEKLIVMLQSLQESKCPNLSRLALERNLISSNARRKLWPIPPYVSY